MALTSTNEENKTDEVKRKIGPYTIYESLGKGGFSWVKKGVHEKTNEVFALKFMIWDRERFSKHQANQMYVEISSMIRISNPHVMKLETYDLDCSYPDKSGKMLRTMMLVLEYCPGGELFDILLYTHKLEPVTARTYLVQLLTGLKACHDVGVVHRDIKPQNLLLDDRYQLKIADFGLSFLSKQHKDARDLLKSCCGTPGYQAPELIKGEWYTKACDIFSCGVVLFILLTGYPPFRKAWKHDKYYRALCEDKSADFWKNHSGVKLDKASKQLITGMLAYRGRERLTLEECLQHKWVAGQKVHNPKELFAIVKEKHKLSRSLRSKDEKRVEETSVKIRKRRVINMCLEKDIAKPYPYISSSEELSIFQVTLPVVENFPSSLLTFFASKSFLKEAYVAAVNIFRIAFNDKSQTTISKRGP